MDAYNPSSNTVNDARGSRCSSRAVQFAARKNRSREEHQAGDADEHRRKRVQLQRERCRQSRQRPERLA